MNMTMRNIHSLILFLAMLLGGTALHAQPTADNGPANTVVMRTSMGDMLIELDPERAPATVNNFLSYVDKGFYSDTLFHRVIDGFMIQGGGFSADYQRKPTSQPVSNEAYNGLLNRRYTIAMARTTAPHSATSQFFINTQNNRNLDHTDTTQRGWGYTVFGRVIDGHSVVDAISGVRTGAGGPFGRDVPQEPVIILGVERYSPAVAGSDGGAATTSDVGTMPAPSAGKPEGNMNKVIAPVDEPLSSIRLILPALA